MTETPTPGTSTVAPASPCSPVKNTKEVNMFLEQCALTTTDDVLTTDLLGNILLKLPWEGQIPDHIASTIKVVRLLLVSKLNENTEPDHIALVTDKLLAANQKITEDLAQEWDFFKATVIKQSKHTLKIVEAANTTSSTSPKL